MPSRQAGVAEGHWEEVLHTALKERPAATGFPLHHKVVFEQCTLYLALSYNVVS